MTTVIITYVYRDSWLQGPSTYFDTTALGIGLDKSFPHFRDDELRHREFTSAIQETEGEEGITRKCTSGTRIAL